MAAPLYRCCHRFRDTWCAELVAMPAIYCAAHAQELTAQRQRRGLETAGLPDAMDCLLAHLRSRPERTCHRLPSRRAAATQ